MAYSISVIVPVYNCAEYLNQCVESLLNQTLLPTEILLVDDGSTDNSGALCDKLEGKYSRIKVFHKENGGLVSAWKYGVEHSTGDYLCFVDSDDWLGLNMFKNMSAHLTGNSKEIVSCDYVIERGEGKSEAVYQTLKPGTYERADIEKEVIPNLLGNEQRRVTMSRCMKLTSRQLILDNMHHSDESIRMAEDLTVMLPALLDCERLVIMDHKTYYHYRYVTESMVHHYNVGLYENNLKLKQILLKAVKEKEDKLGKTAVDSLQDQVEREYIYLLLLCVKNEARGNGSGYDKNIREICAKEKNQIKKYPVKISSLSNKLLYLALRRPNWLTIHLVRLAMIIYYR